MRNNGKNEPDGPPVRLKRWVGRWTRQGMLNALLVCLIAGVGLGKQLLIQPRVLQQGTQGVVHVKTLPVTNLCLTDIFLPKTLRIEWDGHAAATVSIVRSTPGGTSIALPPETVSHNSDHFTCVDRFEFTPGQSYVYTVTQLDPPIPPDPYNSYIVDWSDPVRITVVPQQASVTDNQTVDARWDMRYSTWVHQNHKFGTTFYRGGLYAGFNSDNSQVGRSFLRFALPLTPGQQLWPVGSLNAYYTRSYGSGSTTVGCQGVSASWDAPNLTWDTAPALTSASSSVTVTYDGAQPAPAWTHWEMPSDITSVLMTSGTAAFGLGSANEAQGGWAYFAKKEYAGGQFAPVVLYATSAPFGVVSVTVQPNTVKGGSSATGTVTLNGPAPAGGTVVGLTCPNPTPNQSSPVQVTSPVTVPAGATQATFAVTTQVVSAAQTDPIKATGGNLSAVGTVTLTP